MTGVTNRNPVINNTTQGFQKDINTLTTILKRNMFPSWLIDKPVQGYLRNVTTKEALKHDVSNCHFYKLPYIGFYSSCTRKKISSIINKYCKDLNVKVIFSPFKLCNIFSPKDFIPDSLKSRVVYKFTYAGCGARNLGARGSIFLSRGASGKNGEAKNTNLWSRRLRISLPCNFGIRYLAKPVFYSDVNVVPN